MVAKVVLLNEGRLEDLFMWVHPIIPPFILFAVIGDLQDRGLFKMLEITQLLYCTAS